MADSERHGDRGGDEAIEETSSSDARANPGKSGVRSGDAGAANGPIIDNTAASRFELAVDGATAFLNYERADRAIALVHTEVPEHLRGRHIGERLVQGALDAARSQGLRIVATCPFVRAYLKKHPL